MGKRGRVMRRCTVRKWPKEKAKVRAIRKAMEPFMDLATKLVTEDLRKDSFDKLSMEV